MLRGMMTFVNAPSTRYKIIVEEQGLLWCMSVRAPGRTHIRFSNVYGSAEAALEEAETFAAVALAKWGMVLDGPIQWEIAALTEVS